MGANLSKAQMAKMSNMELADALSQSVWGQNMGGDLTPFVQRLREYDYLDGKFFSKRTTDEEWMEEVHNIYMTDMDPRAAKMIKHAWESVMANTERATGTAVSIVAKIITYPWQYFMKKKEEGTTQVATVVAHGGQATTETTTAASQESNNAGATPIVPPEAVELLSGGGAVIARTGSGGESEDELSFQHYCASQVVGNPVSSAGRRFLDQTDDTKMPPPRSKKDDVDDDDSPRRSSKRRKTTTTTSLIAGQETFEQQQSNILRRSSRLVAFPQASSGRLPPDSDSSAPSDSDDENSAALSDRDEEEPEEPSAEWDSLPTDSDSSYVCQQQQRTAPKRKHSGRAKKMAATRSTTGRQMCILTVEERLEQLQAYKNTHGHCNVPGSEPKLGSWVKNVRSGQNKLSANQRAELNAMGFQWKLRKFCTKIPQKCNYTFDERLEQLQAYKNTHGHCNVPCRGSNLGSWVQYVRLGRTAHKVSTDQKAKLNAMGFQWRIRKSMPFEKRLEALKAYKNTHGHCNVPCRDHKLGHWVSNMRLRRKMNTLSADQIAKLNAMGFQWKIR